MKIIHNIPIEEVVNEGFVIEKSSPIVGDGDIIIRSDELEYSLGDNKAKVKTFFFECVESGEQFTTKSIDDYNLSNIKNVLKKVNK